MDNNFNQYVYLYSMVMILKVQLFFGKLRNYMLKQFIEVLMSYYWIHMFRKYK